MIITKVPIIVFIDNPIALQQANNTIQPTMRVGHNKHFLRLPYVLYQPDGKTRVISVDKKGKIIDTTYVALPKDFTLHVVDHKGRFPFDVKLHPVKRPDWQYRPVS